MDDKTGGTAFPTSTWDNEFDKVVDQTKGMTLLDYFAAKAMQGLLANPEWRSLPVADAAAWAYEQADAMLAEREKRNG